MGAAERRSWTEQAPLPVEGQKPPHNAEHEHLVNQAVLVVPGFLERVSPPLLPEHFFTAAERATFEAATAVHRETGAIDVVAVADWLRAQGRLHELPDAKALRVAQLISEHRGILTSTDIEHAVTAAQGVFNLAQQRSLALHMQQALGQIYAGRIESQKSFFQTFESRTTELCRTALRSSGSTSAAEGVRKVLHEIFDPKSDVGTSTGLAGYDESLGMMRPGEYTVLGGSTGNGKTALGLTIAGNAATRGAGVLYVATADMRAPELMLRLLCSWANVWSSKVRKKQLSAYDFAAIQNTAARFNKLPLRIDDAHGQSIQEIDSQVKRESLAFERDHGTRLKIVVIDYLQACTYLGSTSRQSEEQVLKLISSHVKAMSLKHGIHVIGLVQSWPPPPNTKEGDGKPDVSSIKGCKSIANWAENVAFIHRLKENGKYPMRGRAELVIRKSRWGAHDDVPLLFDGPLARFEDDPDRPMTREEG